MLPCLNEKRSSSRRTGIRLQPDGQGSGKRAGISGRRALFEADLLTRRIRAESEGWLGEIEAIDLTRAFLRDKRKQAEHATTPLGMPTRKQLLKPRQGAGSDPENNDLNQQAIATAVADGRRTLFGEQALSLSRRSLSALRVDQFVGRGRHIPARDQTMIRSGILEFLHALWSPHFVWCSPLASARERAIPWSRPPRPAG